MEKVYKFDIFYFFKNECFQSEKPIIEISKKIEELELLQGRTNP